MAGKETEKLIIEAIEYYINNALCKEDKCPEVEVMRKIVKLHDIKTGLGTNSNE
jgi:hypothetical protein